MSLLSELPVWNLVFNKRNSISLQQVKNRISALFGLLSYISYSNIPVKTVVMPVIGTNRQNFDPDKMAGYILQEGYRALGSISGFSSLKVVEMNRDRFNRLSESFDKFLGRTSFDVDKNILPEFIRQKVRQMEQDFLFLNTIGAQLNLELSQLQEVRDSFAKIESVPRYMIAIYCRRLAEMVAKDLLAAAKKSTSDSLANMVESVCEEYSLAKWEKYYFHIMREFGNQGAHIKEKITKNKKAEYHHPSEDDINILLSCSAEILGTWRTLREKI